MAEFRKRTSGTVLLLMLLAACGATDTPIEPEQEPDQNRVAPFGVSAAAKELPAWIVSPATLPPGRVGKNNCTFGFGDNVPLWDFHPDAGCWERNGPDGWIRQQNQNIHFESFPSACGGGPGDATGIRVCRAGGAGQPSPCSLDTTTGPSGCARCVINPVCH